MASTRTPHRVAILEEFARRIAGLPRVRGCVYLIPDSPDACFEDQRLPYAIVYDGTEQEISSDYNGSIEYELTTVTEIAFEYDDDQLGRDGNAILAEYRIALAEANGGDDQLGGRCRSVTGTLTDIHAFPSERCKRRGRILAVAKILYRANPRAPYWPPGT